MAKFTLALTMAGANLLGKALTSKTLTFTKMALGDGEYSGSAVDKTALTAEKVRVNIGELARSGASAILRATVVYADLPSEFKWRELGIYAKDPDGGSDVLYAYANAGVNYDTIGGSDALREMIVRARIAISETADLTINVQSGSTVYVSKAEFDAVADKVNAITSGSGEYGSTVITLTHTYTAPTHIFTGLSGRTGLIPAQFKSAAKYTAGDTATIDGIAYTIQLTGADAPETDLFVAGKSILVDIDTEGKTINFKSGGGLTGGKLGLATAEEDEVFAGKTFYAKDKRLKTGKYDPDWAIKKSW